MHNILDSGLGMADMGRVDVDRKGNSEDKSGRRRPQGGFHEL